MRHSQAKKEENRQLILESAARLLRERGLDAVSVSDIMGAAAMTHGGFYRHFSDKNELVTQALAALVDSEAAGSDANNMPADIPGFADHYLTMAHRNNTGEGCAFAALGAEVARSVQPAR